MNASIYVNKYPATAVSCLPNAERTSVHQLFFKRKQQTYRREDGGEARPLPPPTKEKAVLTEKTHLRADYPQIPSPGEASLGPLLSFLSSMAPFFPSASSPFHSPHRIFKKIEKQKLSKQTEQVVCDVYARVRLMQPGLSVIYTIRACWHKRACA